MISHLPAADSHTARFGSGHLLNDLLQYAGTAKIVFVGDACQLPPVAEASLSAALSPAYWKEQHRAARLFTLTQIVRQQQHNEILEIASRFRRRIELAGADNLLSLPVPKQRNVFATLGKDTFLNCYFMAVQEKGLTQTVAICHSNAQAHDLNNLIRRRLHNKAALQAGDLLMVVQNSYGTELVNGDQVLVKEVTGSSSRAGFSFIKIKVASLFAGKEYQVLLINDLLYNDQPALTSDEVKRLLIDFDERMRQEKVKRNSEEYKNRMKKDEYLNALRAKYGYAITVHKAQGGEWDVVFLYLNSSVYSQVYHNKGGRHPDGADRYHRWFYTAITRAKQKLVVNDCPFIEKFAQRHPEENSRYWRDLQKAKAAAATRVQVYTPGRLTGVVSKLLNQNEQGVNGFIKTDNTKEEIYFILSAKNPLYPILQPGLKLSYEIMPPKGNKGPKATRIQTIAAR
ncbi:ATP-binding domain-containing protein [Ilyomonas limi]